MKIVICRSNRHSEPALRCANVLKECGLDVHCPERVAGSEAWKEMSEVGRRLIIQKLVDDHFRAIDESDVVLVFNKGGYIGASVNIEIGYAVAKEKRVYTIEADDDPLRSILFEGIAETPEKLVDSLRASR